MSAPTCVTDRLPAISGEGGFTADLHSRHWRATRGQYRAELALGAVGALSAPDRTSSVPQPDPHGQPNASWTMEPSKPEVLAAVVRRLVPHLIEATVIPTVLFYTALATA